MIAIALVIPYAGGIVSVILGIGAVTGGPLLVPTIWALVSRRLSGRATMTITVVTLSVNMVFKMLLPSAIDFRLDRAQEMMLGMGLPILLVALYEWWSAGRHLSGADHSRYLAQRAADSAAAADDGPGPAALREQNRFGLRVISASLAFTSILVFALALFTEQARVLTMSVSGVILLLAWIPFHHQRRIQHND
jgi:type II secretory pathway component PulM